MKMDKCANCGRSQFVRYLRKKRVGEPYTCRSERECQKVAKKRKKHQETLCISRCINGCPDCHPHTPFNMGVW